MNEQSTTPSCEAQHHEEIDYLLPLIIQTESQNTTPLQTEESPSSSEVNLTPLICQIKNLLFNLISKHRLQDLLVQDQCAHIAGELMLLEEYDTLEHIRQLTQLHSRLAEESTMIRKDITTLTWTSCISLLIVFLTLSLPLYNFWTFQKCLQFFFSKF